LFHKSSFKAPPWVELVVEDQHLRINLGFNPLNDSLPSHWIRIAKFLYTCRIADLENVSAWIAQTFSKLADTSDYRVTGWIDG